MLNASGLGSTSLCCSRKAVTDGVLEEAEFSQIMSIFKDALPPEHCDPSSLGRIRFCTILPVATAALVCRQHGRSGASLAWLRAFSQSVPESWVLHEEAEQNAANNEVDLVLQDQLEAQGDFEVEETSFREELLTMPVFSPVADDEERMKTYILTPVASILKKELDEYLVYRTATFAARRQGGAVQSISAEGDKTALLRFYGYLTRTNRVPEGALLYMPFMIRADLGDIVQEYASWLQNTQRCRFTTIANYLNGLVSITTYCYANLAPSDAVLQMEPNPLSQIINLRAQAEKASKQQQMYDKRIGGWLTWEDVQKARVKAFEKLDESQFGTAEEKRFALRDAAALSLLSLIPPDRVGCIRKLRLDHTLKKKEGGGWKMDLSKQRDGHKTSRFYGPFAASLPGALTPILDEYCRVLELAAPVDGGAYLFHPPQSQPDRPLEPSAWSGWVRRLFKRHYGEEVAPKTLRSVFITWLRDSTSAPEVLKSAAHAMKHSEARQASGAYDQEADDRLVKAAYDFNLSYAAQYRAELPSSNGAGSSSAHGAAAAAAPTPPRPSRPGKERGMEAARALAGGAVMVAGSVVGAAAPAPVAAEPVATEPAAAAPVPAPEPLTDEQIAERLAALQCDWVDEEQTELRGVADTSVEDVGALLDTIGSEYCKLMLPERVYVFKRSMHADRTLNCTSQVVGQERDDEHGDGLLADEEWQRLEGGPWVAKLMRASRQPVATASYRNYQLPISFNPHATVLSPSGQLKLPVVPGAPEDGIVLQLPSSWTSRSRTLVFRLKLSKAGATANSVTINEILHRVQVALTDGEGDGDGVEAGDLRAHEPPLGAEPAHPVVPLAAVPPAALAVVVPHDSQPPPPAESVAGSEGAVDAIQAAARDSHMELNMVLPGAAEGSMAARARELLARSAAPLPGEGEAAVEQPSVGGVPDTHAEQMAAVVEAAEAGAEEETSMAADEEPHEEPAAAEGRPPTPPAEEQQQAPPPAPERASQRASRKRARFGDAGELDGAASSFRSAPAARKASIDQVTEMGVPAFALPGETVWAMGLHAGTRKRFRAEVIKLRTQFPRIVVKYTATEGGGTLPLELPDPVTAYLHAGDVEPFGEP